MFGEEKWLVIIQLRDAVNSISRTLKKLAGWMNTVNEHLRQHKDAIADLRRRVELLENKRRG